MKTAIEWMRELKWRASKEEIQAIQRDAWEAGAKAQRDSDDVKVGTCEQPELVPEFSLAPFPGETK